MKQSKKYFGCDATFSTFVPSKDIETEVADYLTRKTMKNSNQNNISLSLRRGALRLRRVVLFVLVVFSHGSGLI